MRNRRIRVASALITSVSASSPSRCPLLIHSAYPQILAKDGGCFPDRGFSETANVSYGPDTNTFGALCLVRRHLGAYDHLHLGNSATSQAVMGPGVARDGR